MNKFIKKILVLKYIGTLGISIRCFDDDIALLADLERVSNEMEQIVIGKYNMKINEKKTKILVECRTRKKLVVSKSFASPLYV